MGFLSSLVGKVAGPVLGSVASGLFSAKSASDNRDFQEEMSNTSYQRAMKDMRKAGLNPILASKLGGASTPPGAMAQIPDLGQSLNAGMNTALAEERLGYDAEKIDAEIEKLVADKNLTEEQTINIKQLTQLAWEQTNNAKKEGISLDYKNIVDAIITKFKHENPNLTLMQAFGLDGRSLSNLINTVVGGGILGKSAGALMKKFGGK